MFRDLCNIVFVKIADNKVLNSTSIISILGIVSPLSRLTVHETPEYRDLFTKFYQITANVENAFRPVEYLGMIYALMFNLYHGDVFSGEVNSSDHPELNKFQQKFLPAVKD